MRALRMRGCLLALCLMALQVSGCRTARAPGAAQPEATGTTTVASTPVTVTRGEFTLPAKKLDVWNAVGQIVVRTDGVDYLGRAQMLDLYSLRYRGVEFLVLTKSMTAAETGNVIRTRVTAATSSGKPIDSNATAELLGMLQRALPAEIESVRARQAAPKPKKPKKPVKKRP